ncbi:MAG: peptide chain release factor H [Treponema sp.]|nr:peptide chain release factor H [Treponema sp.]
MDTIWLSISAGSGPEECAYAAGLTLRVLLEDIRNRGEAGIKAAIIETEPSRIKGNIRSALFVLEGKGAKPCADSWTGVIQWIWRSAYRPHHKRKNWFVQVMPCGEPETGELFSLRDVRFETARAGGPGGQYVNKTETAVRAVHIPTGKSAAARGERSQRLNKRLALARLAALFAGEQADREKRSRSALRHSHWELERGNPVRVYDGETLKLIADHSAAKGEERREGQGGERHG